MTHRVIDVHIHVAPILMMHPAARSLMEQKRPDFESYLELTRDPDKLLALMDREGIERTGIINYVSRGVIGFTEEVNDWAARYTAGHRDRFIAFGSVDPTSTPDPGREMDRITSVLRLDALKLHPPHQLFHANGYRNGLAALEVIYTKAQQARLPVMIHTGTSVFPTARNIYADPMPIDDVAVDFPELTIILAHAGRPLFMQTAAFLVRRHPNVWMDISGIPPQSLLEYFPKLEQLSDRVLWGSDWPGPLVPGMRVNLDRFLALPLSEAAKERILYSNAAKLFPVR